jgi:hypothetical protein
MSPIVRPTLLVGTSKVSPILHKYTNGGRLLPQSARKCQLVILFHAYCATYVLRTGMMVQWEGIGKEVTAIYLLCQEILCYFVQDSIKKHIRFLKRKE